MSSDNWARRHRTAELALASELRKYFVAQIDALVAAVEDHSTLAALDIAPAFDVDAENKKLLALVADPFKQMMGASAELVFASLPEKAKKLTLPEAVEKKIKAQIEQVQRQPYWREIQQATQKKASDIVRKAQRDGLSVEELAAKLRKVLRGIAKSRAQGIARTETTMALNAGQHAACLYLKGRVHGKEWRSVLFRSRDSHVRLHGVKKRANQRFSVGGHRALFPAHWSLPAEERVNCRCHLRPVYRPW